MGAFCGTEREGEGRYVKISESSTGIINAIEFYDVIVCIQSIKDVIKGWNVIFSERFKNYKEIFINDKVLKIGIIGNSNKGKSFILSKLSKIQLPYGTSIKTEGLSIKYPDLEKYKNRKIALLDSAGLETPVVKTNNENYAFNEKEKKEQNINIEKQERNRSEYFKEKSREKLITELFLQNYIIHNSDILIVVVGLLTYSEQKLLNRIKIELKRAKLNKTLYIIHNLMTYTTIEQVESYINDTLLKSATFELEKHIQIDTKIESQNGVRYFEKYSKPQIFHLIFANEYSEAGRYYNENTLSFLENSYEKITDLEGFNIIKTVKERFKEVSKDIIENLQGEIEFDDYSDSMNLIRLKNNQEITLKKCFIDELGFSNIRANGFEPNYSYYKTNNQIVIKVEAPGHCNIESTIQFSGEYIFIKISGKKERDEESSKIEDKIFNGREFGHFSLDIPLKQENFYIKNEQPKIEKKDGIFILIYQLEEKNLRGVYPHQKKYF